MTTIDIDAYLARLGVAAPPAATPAALNELLSAHVRRIPFENMLIQLGRPAALRADTTVTRITTGGGGYCLELNGAFGSLLEALGYQVERHEGRVWTGTPDPTALVNHLALTVRCTDASQWFAEVGMSDAVCAPLPLVAGEYRHGPFGYRIARLGGPNGPGWRFHHDPGGSFGGMDFHVHAARTEVLERAHRRLSTSPESPFTRLFSVGRRDLSGADVLRGRVLIRWDAEGKTRRLFDDAKEWFALLEDFFGLPISALGTDERDALWSRVCDAHAGWEASQQTAGQRIAL
jgi:arylamine N-acetyltransferase